MTCGAPTAVHRDWSPTTTPGCGCDASACRPAACRSGVRARRHAGGSVPAPRARSWQCSAGPRRGTSATASRHAPWYSTNSQSRNRCRSSGGSGSSGRRCGHMAVLAVIASSQVSRGYGETASSPAMWPSASFMHFSKPPMPCASQQRVRRATFLGQPLDQPACGGVVVQVVQPWSWARRFGTAARTRTDRRKPATSDASEIRSSVSPSCSRCRSRASAGTTKNSNWRQTRPESRALAHQFRQDRCHSHVAQPVPDELQQLDLVVAKLNQ